MTVETPGRRPPRTLLAIAALLAVSVCAAYWGAGENGFVDYDDDHYIFDNERVRAGLTTDGVRWALTTVHGANWHPLTWVSHMLDCEWFGLDAGGHHRVGVGLHAASAVLLLLALWRMTGAVWAPAAVAALFALHPLRVESVVWAAERKDVLSGLLFMSTLLAYAHYARRPGPGRYLLVFAALALGLSAKPMLVTAPLVLLLLDLWPLGRREAGLPRLLLEKLPLLGLSVAAAAVTSAAQRLGGTVQSLDRLSFLERTANAATSYLVYVGKTVWPTGLACIYPHPALVPGDRALTLWLPGAASLLVLALLSGAALRGARRRPWLAVGWLWYVGMLVPVAGLVQVGFQARADRYTYLPSIGLCILVVWGLAEWAGERCGRRRILGALTAAACLALLLATRAQVPYWRDTRTLFARAVAVTDSNYVAHNNLGGAYEERGESGRALEQFEAALALRPDFSQARYNLGIALLTRGDLERAAAEFETILGAEPGHVDARARLGSIRRRQGRTDDARTELERAIRARPREPTLHHQLGMALAAAGDMEGAERALRRALELDPRLAEARLGLGLLLGAAGDTAGAREELERAIALRPGYAEAHYRLGLLRAGQRDAAGAIESFERAIEARPDHAETHYNLGVAYALTAARERAAASFREALRLQPDHAAARRGLQQLGPVSAP